MIQSTKNDDDTIIGRDDFEILVKKASHLIFIYFKPLIFKTCYATVC